ncbi:MAG: hypothetical protein ACE5IG_01640 [Dehalococcoidia bacterium]
MGEGERLLREMEGAEVISLFFPLFRKSLVIDTRCTLEDGPMVRLLPMVASPEERLRSIRRLRPHFPRPRAVAFLPWHGSLRSLVSLGVWDKLLECLARTGSVGAVKVAEGVLEELERLEREAMFQLIRGENYYTVWTRRG